MVISKSYHRPNHLAFVALEKISPLKINMWPFSKSLDVPSQEGYYYLSKKVLKKPKNADTILLRNIICEGGHCTLTPSVRSSARILLGTVDKDVKKTTFVQYERADGKPEEIRLDKLFQVSATSYHYIYICSYCFSFWEAAPRGDKVL